MAYFLGGKTCACNLGKLALSTAAFAFSTSALAAQPQGSTANGAGSSTAPGSDSSGLEDIIVTAQHRAENLRNVPIAVNAVTGDALKASGISDSSNLVQIVPSLNFTRSGPSGIFVIRGVATPNGASGEEGSTAVYVDDVYMPDLAQTVNNFNNIERIEVLNGPQGTLFGRNATGGAVRIITRDPGDHTEVHGQFGYGNYDTASAQLYLTSPINDKVGWDLAFTGQDQGRGFGYDPSIDQKVRRDKHWGVRSKLVARPTDTLKITLAGDYYQTHDTTALYLYPVPIIVANGTGTPTGPISSQNSKAAYPSGSAIKVWGLSAKAELDLNFATATSISSYRKLVSSSSFDIDANAADILHLNYNNGSETFQQELRLTSRSTEPLSWQVGAFYLHGIVTQNQFLYVAGPTQHIVAREVTDSISAFGEATYALTPTTHLTGGVRWTSDHRALPTGYTDLILASGTVVPGTRVDTSVTYRQVTYRGALRQDLTDHINIYASVNRGFKAGEYNLQTPADPPVRPETIMAYEGGLKGEFLDHHLRVNLAGFHYDIDNYQVRSSPGGLSQLQNAARVKINGVDVTTETALTNHLRLNVGASWLNSRFDQYLFAPGSYPVGFSGIASGNLTALAPHFTANVGADYTVSLGGHDMRLSANYIHKSSYVFEADNVLRQPSYDVVNASAQYQLNDHVGLELYMRNIGNELYNVQMVTTAGAQALAGLPRQYGFNFKFDF